MSASERMRLPAATSAPPIQLASTGLPGNRCAYCLSRSAVSVGSVWFWGERIVRIPSASLSAPAASTALPYVSASALPRRSTGFPGAGSAPAATSASVASTAGPPALVRMLNRRPLGRGCLASVSAMLKRSAMESTRSTPVRRKAAVKTSSLPARAPVWDAAAAAACALRPPLRTMIGLRSVTSRAAERKARASPTDSM